MYCYFVLDLLFYRSVSPSSSPKSSPRPSPKPQTKRDHSKSDTHLSVNYKQQTSSHDGSPSVSTYKFLSQQSYVIICHYCYEPR